MRISRRTLRIVHQNIAFALVVKALVLALGALGMATMWEAVFADVGVMVLAILNAMRALKAPPGAMSLRHDGTIKRGSQWVSQAAPFCCFCNRALAAPCAGHAENTRAPHGG